MSTTHVDRGSDIAGSGTRAPQWPNLVPVAGLLLVTVQAAVGGTRSGSALSTKDAGAQDGYHGRWKISESPSGMRRNPDWGAGQGSPFQEGPLLPGQRSQSGRRRQARPPARDPAPRLRRQRLPGRGAATRYGHPEGDARID